ncbi:MAG: polymer-forming cytoskeletal protein [Nanoarchaeota archaeon]|nr:polymer-forming cytoskeletal protein [Actinomycetota bacterium]MBL7101079.1 polymer-forming cytoskeletal protein [Nanoarchaeota archaeon]
MFKDEETEKNFDSRDPNSSGESRSLMSIKGDSASIEGNFEISESIEVDCEVKGSMNINGQITILSEGHVSADIKTKDAEILGRYEGSMEASGKVEIKETGLVDGSIKTDSLIINQGGIFSGNVERMTKNDKNRSNNNQLETAIGEEEEAGDNQMESAEEEEAGDNQLESAEDEDDDDMRFEE